MNTLTNELSTGKKSDIARAVGLDSGRLAHLDNRLTLLGAFELSGKELSNTLGAMQLSLGAVETARSDLTNKLITINSGSSQNTRDLASSNGQDAFEKVVSSMNVQFGGRSLFGGAQTNGPVLADASDMLADIQANIGALTSASDVITAVDDWFDSPTGGFASMGYLGGTGAQVEQKLGDGTEISSDFRANSDEVRNVLKGTVIAAIATNAGGATGSANEVALLKHASELLLSSGQEIVGMQALVGQSEQRIDENLVQYESEAAALSIARNNMVSTDPFETATALEQTQIQLETHYTLTARLSRLSLTEYLR
ncbi:flagellin [Aestuariibius sp. HNIBRBA575]|uniref:flagellin n=1 Tax=Aestuariibius sp. HNIBRBA575 TaxID=3233343 RepID=UPI0034A0D4B1